MSCPVKITEDNRKIIGDGAQLDHLLPKQTFHSCWDSPEAYARYIETLSPSNSWYDQDPWNGRPSSFYGSNNMDEALQLARHGWKEGAEKIEKLRSYIQAANPKSAQLVRYDIAGSTPNVPRAVAGNIFNMKAHNLSKSHKKPVITLVANMSANCGIDKDMISNRAAVLAALVDEVESAGFSCEVIATAMSKGRGKAEDGTRFKAATSIIVKPSHQPVDTVKLAFALGHASLFRRMIFADWMTEKTCQAGLGYGLGNAGGGFKEEQEELREKGIYMLPSAETKASYFKDEDTVMSTGLPYLIQYLKNQGCPPFATAPEWKDPDPEVPPHFLDSSFDDD